ncbi:MAG: hypothetical protein L6Q99_14480 [Planctomycetes bacterium]|nr:hypothetical protein [Planctomycetota bacterium]
MSHSSDRNDATPRIQTPCTKRWDELERDAGSGARRYCHECRLHVHDGSSLTREQARELVRTATERVCMRFELDDAGEPRFREPQASALDVRATLRRLVRWSASAAVGALAACSGSDSTAPSPGAGEPPSKMGKVHAPELLGDFGVPTVTTPAETPAQPVDAPPEALGEVYVPPQETPQEPPLETPATAGEAPVSPGATPGATPGVTQGATQGDPRRNDER